VSKGWKTSHVEICVKNIIDEKFHVEKLLGEVFAIRRNLPGKIFTRQISMP